MKTAMQKFAKVIDVRIEKTTNEQSLKILKMIRKDINMFLEIEERQIKMIYEKGLNNEPLD
jgi:queuine/archaeosine tRNA-ribosyltransferase